MARKNFAVSTGYTVEEIIDCCGVRSLLDKYEVRIFAWEDPKLEIAIGSGTTILHNVFDFEQQTVVMRFPEGISSIDKQRKIIQSQINNLKPQSIVGEVLWPNKPRKWNVIFEKIIVHRACNNSLIFM